MIINTYEDARNYFINSGYFEWKFYKGFKESDLIEFIYRNSDNYENEDAMIKDFLIKNNQNPSHYF